MAQTHRDFRFIIVHANANESREKAASYFADLKGLPLEIVYDDFGEWLDHFNALKTPHAFLVNQKGEILFSGGITNSSLASEADRNFLEETLSEYKRTQKITEPRQRALGCLIERRKK